MFLDCHELDCVVAVFGYPGKDIGAEFLVGAYAFLVFGHAYVGLIDEQRPGVGDEFLDSELIGLFRSVDFGGENLGVGVLYHAAGVGGYPFPFAAVPEYAHLVEVAVMDGFGGKQSLPGAVFKAVEVVAGIILPSGECAG